ncbi:hypothetical protein [uncultured Jatrophihabitans sp.]|uniref:hypothetical protein n=1 Tax=uncultured Jatrophihabitans sp. TaxID=1610747 RepID=UPI0035CA35EC
MAGYESDPGRREFGEYVDLQRTVVPVVSWEDERFYPQGSAVSIGIGGWFITAKHILEDPQRRSSRELRDGRAGLFIIWEFD